MPFEPLRFMHAAHLCLDHPLQETGPLPEKLREIVEDATPAAFERVVSQAVEHRVDFVLLTGNSFIEAERSLRARAALIGGLRRLAEHAIPAFILPGELDPPEAWRDIPDLPGNTTVFFNPAGEPVAVLREGRVIASIAVGDAWDAARGASRPQTTEGSRRRPFTIGLVAHGDAVECPFDYAALAERGNRRSVATKGGGAHNPGAVQGLSPRDTGPHGATLVEVGPEGTVERTFLAAAPVRWERFTIAVDDDTGRDELIERMRSALGSCGPEAAEQAWLIRWGIYGSGPLFDALQRRGAFRADVLAGLGLEAAFDRRVLVHHGWRFYQRPPRREALDESDTGDERDEALSTHDARAHGAWEADYFARLEDELPLSQRRLLRLLEQAPAPGDQDADWTGRLRCLVGELDQDAIAGEARRLGIAWFAAPPEEGAHS